MKPLGAITRGTTNPNRLRRMDNWIAYRFRPAPGDLVVDLGFGATPVTVVELQARLGVRVVGVEIDPERVALATRMAPRLEFRRGGFELAGLRPVLVRAANVLRQYPEAEVAAAWAAMTAHGAIVIDGTCDELGRLGSWLTVTDRGPVSLTLAARLSTLESPASFAERLPKALIHHNVPGERIHDLLRALDQAWTVAAPLAVYGPRQRFAAAAGTIRAAGWPVLHEPRRWRFGELTVRWP